MYQRLILFDDIHRRQNGERMVGEQVVDGDFVKAWASDLSEFKTNRQWLSIDLGQKRRVVRMKVYGHGTLIKSGYFKVNFNQMWIKLSDQKYFFFQVYLSDAFVPEVSSIQTYPMILEVTTAAPELEYTYNVTNLIQGRYFTILCDMKSHNHEFLEIEILGF